MPKETKYAGLIASLTQAQTDVDLLMEHESYNIKRIARAINLLAKTLIEASQTNMLNAQLIGSVRKIGYCVLNINGQKDINHPNCLPIPEVNSSETFKLGIIVLKLLLALDPQKDPAIEDYLQPLNMTSDWQERLSRSPIALVNKLQDYYLQASPDTQQNLLDFIPEDLLEIKNKLKAENTLQEKKRKFTATFPKFLPSTALIQLELYTKQIQKRDTGDALLQSSTSIETPNNRTQSLVKNTYPIIGDISNLATKVVHTIGTLNLASIVQLRQNYDDDSDDSSSVSSDASAIAPTESLQNFHEEVDQIKAKLLDIFIHINANKKCIDNYLQTVHNKLNDYTNDNSPNKHIYFPQNNYEVTTEQYFQDYNSFENLRTLIDQVNKAIHALPADIPEQKIKRINQQVKILLLEAKNMETTKAAAIQSKEELYAAIKDSPPLKIDEQMFSKSNEIPSWYMRALTYKMLPYISAFIFAIGLASIVICTGLMLNNPAFTVFSLKALNNIVTPLCITGITLGSTATIISGTSLISASMFRNLRNNPDKIINLLGPLEVSNDR